MRDHLLILLALCTASAEPAPATAVSAEPAARWEYALVAALEGGHVAIETAKGEALPGRGLGDLSSAEPITGPNGEALDVRNVAGALTYAGSKGWEIVDFMGHGVYLARRAAK